jgi:hypothetical protein
MSSRSRGSEYRGRHHLHAALAMAALLAAIAGVAEAQVVISTVAVTVQPHGNPPPPKGACGSTPPGPTDICVTPDPALTYGNSGDDVEVDWNVQTNGWVFQNNQGIKFKTTPGQWNFTCKSTKKYCASNKKEDGTKRYDYKVNLINGLTKLSWDPFIMN